LSFLLDGGVKLISHEFPSAAHLKFEFPMAAEMQASHQARASSQNTHALFCFCRVSVRQKQRVRVEALRLKLRPRTAPALTLTHSPLTTDPVPLIQTHCAAANLLSSNRIMQLFDATLATRAVYVCTA